MQYHPTCLQYTQMPRKKQKQENMSKCQQALLSRRWVVTYFLCRLLAFHRKSPKEQAEARMLPRLERWSCCSL